MKNIMIFVIILLSCSLINAQNEKHDIIRSRKKIVIKPGYSFPYKGTFRKNYSYRFNAGIEGMCAYSNTTAYFVEITCRYNKNSIFSDTDLFIFPVYFGIKYYLNHFLDKDLDVKFYTGAGAGYYFVYFRKKSILFYDAESIEEKEGEYSRNYHGYGIKVISGIEWYIDKQGNIGLEIDFDITRVGNAKTGGLGNIGGLSIKMLIAFPI